MIKFNVFPENIRVSKAEDGLYEAYQDEYYMFISSYSYDKIINKIHIKTYRDGRRGNNMKRPKFKIQMTDVELDKYSAVQDRYIDYLEGLLVSREKIRDQLELTIEQLNDR